MDATELLPLARSRKWSQIPTDPLRSGILNSDYMIVQELCNIIQVQQTEIAELKSERSLRDWFAGMALAEVPDPVNVADAGTTAKLAYAIADAMMKERSK